jgi:hypothetical protein
MAKIFRLAEADQGSPQSELGLLDVFSGLDDDWHVFHSVRWQSARAGRQGDGEADFILANRRFGALVVEVKGGGVHLQNGRWLSRDRYGAVHPIKNPYAQASDSKHALIAFLAATTPSLSHIRVGHAVVLPDVDTAGGLGPAATPGITINSRDLTDIGKALESVFAYWGSSHPFSTPDLQRLVTLLAPTVNVERTLGAAVRKAEAEIITLTARQQRVFDSLRGVARLLVCGGPGTGKTLLAIERARLLAAQGASVKVICFNDLLSKTLANAFVDMAGVEAMTFHALCVRAARATGKQVPRAPDGAWWDMEAPSILQEWTRKIENRVDAIVIDEGQDFAPSWFDALRTMLVDESGGTLCVFADDRQELWRRGWRDGLPAFGEMHLWENCRNSTEILRCVNAIYGDPPPEGRVNGAPVAVINYGKGEDVVFAALTLAERLIEDHGIEPTSLTILTDDSELARRLRDAYAGDHPIVEFGGNGIACETVTRFKGLETSSLLLVLTRTNEADSLQRANAYVGLSRARAAAVVLIASNHRAAVAIDAACQRK